MNAIVPADDFERGIREQLIPLQSLSSPSSIRGVEYWRTLLRGRPYPARREIQPRPIAPILHDLLMISVIGDGEEFQYRIVGGTLVRFYGGWIQNATTADVDSRFPGYGRSIRNTYRLVYTNRAPLALRGKLLSRGPEGSNISRILDYECVLLPLGEDGMPIDHIMNVCAVFS